MRPAKAIALTALLGLGVGAIALPAGCTGFNDGQIAVACGDLAQFGNVSGVLEKRCGTIDCHGSMARPMRIYGREGLRKPIDFDAAKSGNKDQQLLANEVDAGEDQYFPGGNQATTPSELLENYRAVCGLEPELTTLVVQHQEKPETLTLIRKMRLLEKHKGGRVFSEGDPGDICVVEWLTQTTSIVTPVVGDAGAATTYNPAPCAEELKHN